MLTNTEIVLNLLGGRSLHWSIIFHFLISFTQEYVMNQLLRFRLCYSNIKHNHKWWPWCVCHLFIHICCLSQWQTCFPFGSIFTQLLLSISQLVWLGNQKVKHLVKVCIVYGLVRIIICTGLLAPLCFALNVR